MTAHRWWTAQSTRFSGLSPKTGLSRIVVGAAGNDGATRVHIGFKLAAGETKGTLVVVGG